MESITATELKRIRADWKMSQAAFAQLLGVNPRTYEGYESGRFAVPGTVGKHVETIQKLRFLIGENMEKEISAESETFTKTQIIHAIEAWIQYGEQSYVGEGEFTKGHRGYFSNGGWAARVLRSHLAELKTENETSLPELNRL